MGRIAPAVDGKGEKHWAARMQAAQHAQMLQEEAIKKVDLRRRMRATVVPVIDVDVRAMLRQLGEPITLFGEQEVQAASCPDSMGM